ncbi:NUDIX hydrolase [Kitasatospora sp. NPDC059599]|uniref:NUDIX hydrolase n=1 Tax=Kitasatospora sp. NPDC059599 TaxID=3346880 RepID=UPI0036BD4F4A
MRIAPDGPALTAVSTAARARTSARTVGTASTEPESGTGRPGAGRFAAVLSGVVGHGSFPLPGGRTDIGGSLAGCGVRETREEAGIDVEITGIVGT